MTVKEFKDTYAKKLSDAELASIFDSLKIAPVKAYNNSYILTEEEINKLMHSDKIRKVSINDKILDNYSSLASGYSDLINKYNVLLEKDSAGNYIHIDPSDANKVIGLRDRIVQEESDYNNFMTKLNNMSNIDELFIDNGNGSIIDNNSDKIIVGIQQDKINNLDDRLGKQYDRIDDLKNQMNQYSSNIMKNVYQRRINRIQNRVNKLRQRKGKISSRQRVIINKNASRFKQKMMQNFELEKSENYAITSAVTERKGLIDNSSSLGNDISINEATMNALFASPSVADKLKGVGRAIDNSRLNSAKRRVDARIALLAGKVGTVDVGSQLVTTHQGLVI